jgi:hypothetical protein
MSILWQIDPNSIKEIQASLKQFELKVAKKILRQGVRSWGKETISALKSNMTWNERKLKSKVKMKVKTLRKNRGIWVGVGIESSVRLGKEGAPDAFWAATKARWYNDGWTAIPKGYKSGKKTRGWRKGLRGIGGKKVWETHFLEKTAAQMLPKLPSQILKTLEEAVKETNQGK